RRDSQAREQPALAARGERRSDQSQGAAGRFRLLGRRRFLLGRRTCAHAGARALVRGLVPADRRGEGRVQAAAAVCRPRGPDLRHAVGGAHGEPRVPVWSRGDRMAVRVAACGDRSLARGRDHAARPRIRREPRRLRRALLHRHRGRPDHCERIGRGAARCARVRDRHRERTRRSLLAARQSAARGCGVREREGEPSHALVSALPSAQVAPRRRLGVAHAVSVCVGMVIGAGIFKSTPLAAAVDLAADAGVLALWVFGGAMSLAGALCFAELAAAFPDPGGDYFFLRKAYGAEAGFLFAWSRFAVIHTGSMAMLAFSFGDYLAAIADVGPYGSAPIAAATIVALAALNLAGLRFGIGTQLALMFVVIAGLILVGGTGLWLAAARPPAGPQRPR